MKLISVAIMSFYPNFSRYADQIHALIFKIPSLELLNIQFTWDDALDKGMMFLGKTSASKLHTSWLCGHNIIEVINLSTL